MLYRQFSKAGFASIEDLRECRPCGIVFNPDKKSKVYIEQLVVPTAGSLPS